MMQSKSVNVGAEQQCNNAFRWDSVRITFTDLRKDKDRSEWEGGREEGRIRGADADEQQRKGRGVSVGFTHLILTYSL